MSKNTDLHLKNTTFMYPAEYLTMPSVLQLFARIISKIAFKLDEMGIFRSINPQWIVVGMGLAVMPASANESLFNGRDLTGWKGDLRLWSVENGVLVGQTDKAGRSIPKNSFLIWQGGEFGNFELEFKGRVSGSNNSGVQYRSRIADKEKFSVKGYQLDMHHKQEYLAMLYEEGGRGIICQRGQSVLIHGTGERVVQPLGNVPEANLAVWNDYRIVADGPIVTHWVNGVVAARIEDHEATALSSSGVIALQLHAGASMRVEFKDIVIKRSAAPAPVQAAVPDAGTVPQWIWSHNNLKEIEQTVYFRRTVDIPSNIKRAVVTASCDNYFELFHNGTSIERGADWSNPKTKDITAVISQPGPHLFAVHARNEGGSAGFVFQLEITLADGKRHMIVSDADWKWTAKDERGWTLPGHNDSSWHAAALHGEMGMRPWGEIIRAAGTGREAQFPEDVTTKYKVLPGYKMERIYQVPESQGSWVALTRDHKDGLFASDQNGKIYHVMLAKPGDDGGTRATPLDVDVTGAQGLLWAHGALYAVTNGKAPGVYRITDSDADGKLEHVAKLKSLNNGGEHGPHGLALSPDGKWIYMIAGNKTTKVDTDSTHVPEVWAEDQLLERRPDARGHARDIMAPGGWVARFTPDGERWELVSMGYRNAYDIAFNTQGDLFTYDSDMEYDFGSPWYRPTRLNHVTSGSEYGWRNGTGKWPAYYEDSLPPVIDIGPGSPTGVVSGSGLKFPTRYQNALFILDWTYATIYAIHLQPDGSSYRAEKEDFIYGAGLPMTDATVGTDGSLYFTVGGRKTKSSLYRVSYTGSESTARATTPSAGNLASLRRGLETLHLQPDPAALSRIWDALGHEDRFIRFAARVALEHLPADIWKSRLAGEKEPWQVIQAAMALARTGDGQDQATTLDALERLDPATLGAHQQINLMRAYGLVFARHGNPENSRRIALISRLDPLYPASSDPVNRELCRLLVYLKSPDVVSKSLRLMASPNATPVPDWARLATRNEGYGKTVKDTIEHLPSEQNMHYAYCLRAMPGPWTEGQRRQFLTWFEEAAQKKGGSSYQGFLTDLRRKTLDVATPEERTMIGKWKFSIPRDPLADLPPVKGPGQVWATDDIVAAAAKGLGGRDKINGAKMYRALLCAACHRFGTEGGNSGPDLTAVAGRFSIRDLAEAIVEPSKEISDQFHFSVITKTDGSSLSGTVVDEKDDAFIVAVSAFNLSQTEEIPRSQISTIEPSPISPMPPGLINRLNEDELRDLLAFIMGVE
ncbi:MAG: family 16 glycoside hydrolase [Verrucomicrobiota bacterium]